MSKYVVSGAVALLMVLSPVAVSAYTIPQIPANPTIQQLQEIVLQLSAILQEILNGNTPPSDTSASVSITPSASTYRMGDYASWTVFTQNGPNDANVCVVVVSETSSWQGGFQGFGGSDGCYWAVGNATQTFAANLKSMPGFDFAPGRYHLEVSLIKTYPQSGPRVVYASTNSSSFTVTDGSTPATPTIILTGPANGSAYKVGDSIPISWNYASAPPNSQILLKMENIQPSSPMSGTVSGGGWQGNSLTVMSGAGYYAWPTGPGTTDFTGTYKITASIRECDPRGCSWNADFPGQVSNVHTYATAAPITFVLNSAVTGTPAGSVTAAVSSSPAPQTLVAGQEAIVANYLITASGEDVRLSWANLAYTDYMTVDPTNCTLYDGSTRISTGTNPVYNAYGTTADYSFSIAPAVIIAKNTTKTLSLKCFISANTTSGSFKWGLKAGAYFAAQGVQSGLPITVSSTENLGNLMTIAGGGAGTLNVTTDASSPSFQTVAGGTTNVTSGVYKFRATGENVYLNTIGLQLTSGKSWDVTTVNLYNGQGNLLGTAVFTGNNTTAVSTLFAPLTIGKDMDVTVVVKADYSNVGIAWPGTAGDIIKIDVDASKTKGTGVNSGTIVTASGGTAVAGVQLATPMTGSPRITLGTVSTTDVSAQYYDMPANTQVVVMNQTRGTRVDSAGSSMIGNGGSGTLALNLIGIPAGSYYLKAQNYSTGAYIAQTVSFTFAGTPVPSVTAIRMTDATRPYIRFHIDNLPTSDVQGVFLTGATTGTNVAYTTSINSNGDGYVNMDPVSPAGQYYLKLLAVNGNRTIAVSDSFSIAPIQNGAPTCSISVSPLSVVQGQSVTVSWTSNNATSATFNGGTVLVNGSQTMMWLAGAGTFNMPLVVNGAGGSATCVAVVNATAVTGTLTADIKANGSDGPISIASGQSATISWTSTGAATCSIIPSAQAYWAGNFGLRGSKDSGALTQANTYTLQCQGNGNETVTDTVTVNVTPALPTVCPMYTQPICPAGQHRVIDPTTRDANNCEVPHSRCVPDQVSCTYSPGAVRGAPPSMTGTPVTINIEGGQAACSAWCSSQALESNVSYSCAYNGTAITMIKRDANLASALTALESAVKSLIAWFQPSAPIVIENSAGTSSAPTKWGPTASAKAQEETGTLRASYKSVGLPEVSGITKRLAQALCRADAVCDWNNETIQALPLYGNVGDPTLTFTIPAPASKQSLAAGSTYTFEIVDTSLPAGPIAEHTYRLYFAKYTSKNGPDVIYQGEITGVQRTLSGAVQLKWQGTIQNADGSTGAVPAGFYFVGVTNIKTGLKGGSTGSITITAAH